MKHACRRSLSEAFRRHTAPRWFCHKPLFPVHGENGKRGSGEKVASDGAEASERSFVGASHSHNDECRRAGARNPRDLSSGIAHSELSSIATEHTV